MSSLISPEQEKRILEIQKKLGSPNPPYNMPAKIESWTMNKIIELAEKALNDGNVPLDYVEQWKKLP